MESFLMAHIIAFCRRYGEKQVKGSQFPRSYYRCSHSNCTVRKIVERDPRHGSVASAVYKVIPAVSARV